MDDQAETSSVDTEFTFTAFACPHRPAYRPAPRQHFSETEAGDKIPAMPSDYKSCLRDGTTPYDPPALSPMPRNSSSKASRLVRRLLEKAEKKLMHGGVRQDQRSSNPATKRPLRHQKISKPSQIHGVLSAEQEKIAKQYCTEPGRALISLEQAQQIQHNASVNWAKENPIIDRNGKPRERLLRKRDFVTPVITKTLGYIGGSKRDFVRDAVTGELSKGDFAIVNRYSGYFHGPAILANEKK